MYYEKVILPLEQELEEVKENLATIPKPLTVFDKILKFLKISTPKMNAIDEYNKLKSKAELLRQKLQQLNQHPLPSVNSLEEIASYLNDLSNDVTLDKSDIFFLDFDNYPFKEPHDIQGLIAVHASDYMMKDGVISTPKSTGEQIETEININGITYPISYDVGNNITHISFNGSKYNKGHNNSKKFIYLAPFENINTSNMHSVRPENTEFVGDLSFNQATKKRNTTILYTLPKFIC